MSNPPAAAFAVSLQHSTKPDRPRRETEKSAGSTLPRPRRLSPARRSARDPRRNERVLATRLGHQPELLPTVSVSLSVSLSLALLCLSLGR